MVMKCPYNRCDCACDTHDPGGRVRSYCNAKAAAAPAQQASPLVPASASSIPTGFIAPTVSPVVKRAVGHLAWEAAYDLYTKAYREKRVSPERFDGFANEMAYVLSITIGEAKAALCRKGRFT